MSNLLSQASDEGFLADWSGAGLRVDCRDAFLGALPRSGKHSLAGLTPALRAALRAACRIAYRAGYAAAVIDTYQRIGLTVDFEALVTAPQPEDKVIDLAARRREKDGAMPETD